MCQGNRHNKNTELLCKNEHFLGLYITQQNMSGDEFMTLQMIIRCLY